MRLKILLPMWWPIARRRESGEVDAFRKVIRAFVEPRLGGLSGLASNRFARLFQYSAFMCYPEYFPMAPLKQGMLQRC